jgi:hypothetical protein
MRHVVLKSALKPFLFTLSIFVMAAVYEVMWTVRPDYFRVQSGVNFLPLNLVQIAREYSAYSDSKPLPGTLLQQGEEKAAERIVEIYQKIQQASIALAQKKPDYAKRLEEDKTEYKSFESSQWLQYNSFVSERIAPFVDQINEISRRMQAILAASGVKSPEDLPSGPRGDYFRLNVELKNAELRRATVEYEAREYGLRHLTDFQQQPSQKEYIARYKELEDLHKSVSAEQDETQKLRGDLYDAFLAYRAVTEARLGYGDFLYFSVGAATTATFGDISPNSTRIRILVCLQVLGSIVFVGLMVNELAVRFKS